MNNNKVFELVTTITVAERKAAKLISHMSGSEVREMGKMLDEHFPNITKKDNALKFAFFMGMTVGVAGAEILMEEKFMEVGDSPKIN